MIGRDVSGAWEGRPDPYGERRNLLENETGENFGFTRVVARKKQTQTAEL